MEKSTHFMASPRDLTVLWAQTLSHTHTHTHRRTQTQHRSIGIGNVVRGQRGKGKRRQRQRQLLDLHSLGQFILQDINYLIWLSRKMSSQSAQSVWDSSELLLEQLSHFYLDTSTTYATNVSTYVLQGLARRTQYCIFICGICKNSTMLLTIRKYLK